MVENNSTPTYFTCTLGEAESQTRPFENVNHLLDKQAKERTDSVAIGFYRVRTSETKSNFDPELFTFNEIRIGVLRAARILQGVVQPTPPQALGLLCSSSPQFLFVWLACIRLGCPVLLIDPQCSLAGIRSLCAASGVSLLLVDEKNEKKGRDAIEQNGANGATSLRCLRIPFEEDAILKDARAGSDVSETMDSAMVKATDIAYFHHTSGTSSGQPKPIPQSHHGAVGALPAFDSGDAATFTTTPLYHGGPADIFRAWSSGATIWMFPNRDAPITASNVMRCLECAGHSTKAGQCPPVKYFTCVPYILQMMSADKKGLSMLQQMSLVGVGGAALPKQVGDDLVSAGVRLVSRYGSAECGFLLSSHRPYEADTDWQYLRVPESSPHLAFEPRDGGLSELVVQSKWPHMAKRNREDGSFATSDLFEPHPHIAGAWRYHSRADAQMTLVTGKKFDPAPVEEAVVAATNMISDALVFGNGKPYPGIFLFRSSVAEHADDADVVAEVSPIVEKVNAQSPSHANISADMLIPMPFSTNPIEKSSKGTIMRRKAEERYEGQIEAAYREKVIDNSAHTVPDDELPQALQQLVSKVLATDADLTLDQDLFKFGVDSVAGIQIRYRLTTFLPKDAPRLPPTVIEDCRTLRRLAEYIKDVRSGRAVEQDDHSTQSHQRMIDLVEEYSRFTNSSNSTTNGTSEHQSTKRETIVLTGATGALGAHVLYQILQDPKISRVYCLTRGADTNAARQRIAKALKYRRLGNLEEHNKVEVLPCTLGDAHLGLDDSTYARLAGEATCIIHLAWSVNFRMKLDSFVSDSISSVRNLIDLALAAPQHRDCPSFAFCSSVASAMAFAGEGAVPEKLLDDPTSATNLGYSQSKWVAEQICNRAAQDARLRGKVSIFRVGQLSGDSQTGIWNENEAWPMMLGSVKVTGSLPDLSDEVLNWLPLNIAAEAMMQCVRSSSQRETDIRVYHLVNEHEGPRWSEMLDWLAQSQKFDVLEPQRWIQKLDKLAESGSNHPALRLIDHWKASYAARESSKPRVRFGMAQSKEVMSTLQTLRPVDEAYFERLWSWIDTNL